MNRISSDESFALPPGGSEITRDAAMRCSSTRFPIRRECKCDSKTSEGRVGLSCQRIKHLCDCRCICFRQGARQFRLTTRCVYLPTITLSNPHYLSPTSLLTF